MVLIHASRSNLKGTHDISWIRQDGCSIEHTQKLIDLANIGCSRETTKFRDSVLETSTIASDINLIYMLASLCLT